MLNSVVVEAGNKVGSNSFPSAWFVDPENQYTINALASMPKSECFEGVICVDNECRDFWFVTYAEVEYFEQSRATDQLLSFSVWYKDKQSGKIERYVKTK